VTTIVNIDVMLARRKMSVTELADKVGITMANLSILKNGKAKAIRFSTLEAICKALECQPGDILEYRSDEQSAPRAAPTLGGDGRGPEGPPTP
jgi:putative transcriptional regulator